MGVADWGHTASRTLLCGHTGWGAHSCGLGDDADKIVIGVARLHGGAPFLAARGNSGGEPIDAFVDIPHGQCQLIAVRTKAASDP